MGVAPDDVYEYKRALLIQLLKQAGLVEAYYAFDSGETHNDKGMIKNFNAKTLNREWFTRMFNGEKRVVTTPYTSSIGATVMAVGVPLYENGKMSGTLCLNLGLTDITNFTNHAAYPPVAPSQCAPQVPGAFRGVLHFSCGQHRWFSHAAGRPAAVPGLSERRGLFLDHLEPLFENLPDVPVPTGYLFPS